MNARAPSDTERQSAMDGSADHSGCSTVEGICEPDRRAGELPVPDPARLDAEIRFWHDQGGVVLSERSLSPGRWSRLIDTYLAPRVASSGGPVIGHQAPIWRLDLTGPIPSLIRVESGIIDNAVDVLVPSPTRHVSIKAVLRWRRAGVRRGWFCDRNGWNVIRLEMLLVLLLYQRRLKPLLRRMSPGLRIDDAAVIRGIARWLGNRRGGLSDDDESATSDSFFATHLHEYAPRAEELWKQFITDDNRRFHDPGLPQGRPVRVVHYIGSLSAGGAERQLCNLAVGLSQAGYEVEVKTTYETEGHLGHYAPLLEEAGLRACIATGRSMDPRIASTFRWDLLAAAPSSLRPFITRLALDLARHRPDILHCWLDHPNIMGAIAGLVADVRCILLSTRNSNPTNFPRLYAPYMDLWYRLLAQSRRVHWIANSHSGAASYADYTGIPVERVHVVLNGLFSGRDFDRDSALQRRREARRSFSLPDDAPVIGVINRLSEEKQPELMLKIVSMLKHDLPNVRVLVAGTGPLEERIRTVLARRGLVDTVRLLGRVSEVWTLLSACDVLLLTSTLEGCPNVALEAQHVGIPVVATAGGGTVDAILDGRTGYLCAVDDAVGLTLALRRVLQYPKLRTQLGRNGQVFIDRCFDSRLTVDLTRRIYDLMLTGDPSIGRVVTPRPRWIEDGASAETESVAATPADASAAQIEVMPSGCPERASVELQR